MSDDTTIETIDELLARDRWLRQLARGLVGDDVGAEDVAQEVWLGAVSRPPARMTSPGSWLRRAVGNRAASEARSARRRRRRERSVSRPELATDTAELVARAELQRRLVEEVLRLDEPYRATVLQCYFAERTSAEVAEALGIPAATVRSRLSRALEKLRLALTERDREGRDLRVMLAPLLAARAWSRASVMAVVGILVAIIVLPTITYDAADSPPPVRLGDVTVVVDREGERPRREAIGPSADPAPLAQSEPEMTPSPPPAAQHELWLQFRLLRGGARFDCDVELEAVIDVSGPDSALRAGGALLVGGRPGAERTRARGRTGEKLRIEVGEPGRFTVWASFPGVRNAIRVPAATATLVERDLEIFDRLAVEIDGPDAAGARLRYRLGDGVEGEREARREPDGTWTIEGPIAAGLALGVSWPTRDLVLWHEVREPDVVLRPSIGGMEEILCVDAVTSEILTEVEARCTVRHTNGEFWRTTVRAGLDGRLAIPLASGVFASGHSPVTLSAPGYVTTYVERMERAVAPERAVRGPLSIGLMPLAPARKLVRCERGAAVRGAAVHVCAGAAPVFRGVTDDEGRLEPERLRIGGHGERGPAWQELSPLSAPWTDLWAVVIGEDRSFARIGPWSLDAWWDLRTLEVPVVSAVEVEVVDADSGDPIVGATARIAPLVDGVPAGDLTTLADWTTDRDGVLELPISGGPWQIVIGARGFMTHTFELDPRTDDDVVVVELEAVAPDRIAIVDVVDENGDPCVGALVQWWPARGLSELERRRTDVDGRLQLPLKRADAEYHFRVEVVGRRGSLAVDRRIRADGHPRRMMMVPVDLVHVDLRLPDGTRPSAATVALFAPGAPNGGTVPIYMRWRADGEDRLYFGREEQLVRVVAAGVRSREMLWTPPADGSLPTCTIRLEPGPRVRGCLDRDEVGSSLRLAYRKAPSVFEAQAMRFLGLDPHTVDVEVVDGSFESPPLRPGTWSLEVRRGDDVIAIRSVDVAEDDVDLGVVSIEPGGADAAGGR